MPDRTDVQVRAGEEGDLTSLTALYNHYVAETPITFDMVPFTPAERRPWLLSYSHDGPHRLLVAHRDGTQPVGTARTGTDRGAVRADDSRVPGELLGYATSGPFRAKPAYATSVEVTVYLAPHASGRGIGALLYHHLSAALAQEDVHRAFAGIALPNEPSVRLHRRFGFRHVGTFGEAGRKFGRFWDVAWYEKSLAG